MENYLLAMAVFAAFYALMALGLNVIWGLAGMVNLGLVGFFAIGAYTSALLTVKLQVAMPLAWIAAVAAAAACGIAVALLTARLKGDYLAIVTLGFAEVIRLIASNELWLTGGTNGISNIPGPWRGVLSPEGFNIVFAALGWGSVAVIALLLGRLSASPFGRVLRAIREDEMVAAVAGKRVLAFKVQAFAVGAAVLGFAGALYAHYNAFVAPDGFTALITIYVVLALTAGGTGTMRGAALGGVVVIALTEGSRFLAGVLPELRPVQIASLREAVIGVALIVVLYIRPQGILPERARTLSLEP
ncbi:MAG TPA: branched-chain amino acid ABC transporter permease [Acetobacteraceae bacterium]|jgi:branched-chain amino acid transport system permease protein|nr:branched-chain amino acid ABC transporter permease [Acetobacteraceae bacterium]